METKKKKLIINKNTVKNLILKTEVKTGAPQQTLNTDSDPGSGSGGSIIKSGC